MIFKIDNARSVENILFIRDLSVSELEYQAIGNYGLVEKDISYERWRILSVVH